MKNILRKNLLFITIFTIITIFCFSSPFQWLGDSATSDAVLKPNLLNQSNVSYPGILINQKEQSIAYVKQYSEKNRDFLMTAFNKGKDFFPKIASVFTEFGIPTELKVLIAIESEFKPNAVSRAGAVGYWQLMDEVALDYGLKIGNGKNDDRKNFNKSTNVAARYLKDACNDFGNNILLAVASYNCGSGNVRKAIRKSGVESASFWDIKKFLPKETQSYVMNFIALNVIFDNYDKFTKNQLIFQDQPGHSIASAIPAGYVSRS